MSRPGSWRVQPCIFNVLVQFVWVRMFVGEFRLGSQKSYLSTFYTHSVISHATTATHNFSPRYDYDLPIIAHFRGCTWDHGNMVLCYESLDKPRGEDKRMQRYCLGMICLPSENLADVRFEYFKVFRKLCSATSPTSSKMENATEYAGVIQIQ